MITTSIHQFTGQVSSLLDGEEAVLVTRRGKPAGILFPLTNPATLPAEVRRELYLELSGKIGEQLDARGVTEEVLQRDFREFRTDRRRGQ